MIGFLILLLHVLVSPFKMPARLEAEIIVLRHQLNVLRRRLPSKPRLTVADRLLFVWLYRLFPSVLNAIGVVQPETIIRWHRAGFRLYWRWKSHSRGGRPKVPVEVCRLIREMSLANRLWGAPRIHGELLLDATQGPARSCPRLKIAPRAVSTAGFAAGFAARFGSEDRQLRSRSPLAVSSYPRTRGRDPSVRWGYPHRSAGHARPERGKKDLHR
jgi:hypothetical protein